MTKKIVVIEGDGIGPEVTREAKRILTAVAQERGHQFEFTHHLMGGVAIDATGEPLPAATLEACKAADAILFGAIGGPKWDKAKARPEQGLLALRKGLGLFANLRPVSIISNQLTGLSPLRKELLNDVDMIFVRELTGGIYFGQRQEAKDGKAFDVMEYTEEEIARITRVAAKIALQRGKKIVQVDKANVLATSRLWRQVTERVIKEEFPEITLTHLYVDAASMELIRRPNSFDVILTENLFGDILTDEASMIPGSLGLLPSASLNDRDLGLYEPIHGSAPDIAGKGIANPIAAILSAALLLRYSLKLPQEAEAIESAVRLALEAGARTADIARDSTAKVLSTAEMGDAVLQHLLPILRRKVRAMTLAEKILCDHAIGLEKAEVAPGQMICVKVDWTLASELTWIGMEKTYSEMERPSVWRNDRFWLAIDHTVDPRINHLPKPKHMIEVSSNFAKEAGIVDFYGPNQTILHTDFYRFRVQPGMLVCGADSHSPSAGAVGSFAVGLGAADVVMPLVTGETWFKVPETIRIVYKGQPKFGIAGKDIILYTMGKLKRNTVAHERAVEYTGNIKMLSCDARFAISNMTAEFGGIAGIFEADEVTAAFVAKRPDAKFRGGKYMRADPDAKYAATYELDLDSLDSLIALYPSPDNVVPVSEVVGKPLDGVFIGACTTAEEDLILAALVLEVALAKGVVLVNKGKKRVTPGSLTIIAKLRRLGLIEIYEKAGFEVGAPSCSYCLGVGADKAGEGEVWLSSQNRNFPNRMGKGSIANLASAATVAASSLEMKIADPRPFLDAIDKKKYEQMLEMWITPGENFEIAEPSPQLSLAGSGSSSSEEENLSYDHVLTGKAQVFGDNIDTDAIIPAEFMPGKDDLDLGLHCFEYFRPEFREKVNQGFSIVVGGIGFGCGSSREEAPRALKGCGVQAVIARSFAFIYARNQSNMALLGILLEDERFYQLATEGAEIKIDVPKRKIHVAGESFDFTLSLIEERLLAGGGVTSMYNKYKSELFRKAMAPRVRASAGCGDSGKELTW